MQSGTNGIRVYAKSEFDQFASNLRELVGPRLPKAKDVASVPFSQVWDVFGSANNSAGNVSLYQQAARLVQRLDYYALNNTQIWTGDPASADCLTLVEPAFEWIEPRYTGGEARIRCELTVITLAPGALVRPLAIVAAIQSGKIGAGPDDYPLAGLYDIQENLKMIATVAKVAPELEEWLYRELSKGDATGVVFELTVPSTETTPNLSHVGGARVSPLWFAGKDISSWMPRNGAVRGLVRYFDFSKVNSLSWARRWELSEVVQRAYLSSDVELKIQTARIGLKIAQAIFETREAIYDRGYYEREKSAGFLGGDGYIGYGREYDSNGDPDGYNIMPQSTTQLITEDHLACALAEIGTWRNTFFVARMSMNDGGLDDWVLTEARRVAGFGTLTQDQEENLRLRFGKSFAERGGDAECVTFHKAKTVALGVRANAAALERDASRRDNEAQAVAFVGYQEKKLIKEGAPIF